MLQRKSILPLCAACLAAAASASVLSAANGMRAGKAWEYQGTGSFVAPADNPKASWCGLVPNPKPFFYDYRIIEVIGHGDCEARCSFGYIRLRTPDINNGNWFVTAYVQGTRRDLIGEGSSPWPTPNLAATGVAMTYQGESRIFSFMVAPSYLFFVIADPGIQDDSGWWDHVPPKVMYENETRDCQVHSEEGQIEFNKSVAIQVP